MIEPFFDATQKSLFILEGLTMYLEEDIVTQLISSIKDLNQENEIIISFLSKSEISIISENAKEAT